MNPLVTVNILSFNRKDELKNTLQKVYEQSYKNIEVIVVDNASSDGSPQMVKKEFPAVILVELDNNIGIAGWNKGFEIAKGEYVLVLDDDSYPSNITIEKLMESIKSDRKCGIVAAKIINTRYNFCETEKYPPKPLTFVGCGALVESKKLSEVGYFDSNIFIYLNELDLSARFWDKGFSVIYCNEAVVYHIQSTQYRLSSINPFISDYRYTNSMWGMSYFLMTKFSIQYLILSQSKWLMNRLLIAIFHIKPQLFLKGAIDLIRKMKVILSNRKVLNYSTQKLYRYGNIFPLVDRDYFPNFTNSKIYKLLKR